MEILKFTPCEEIIQYRKQFNSFEEAWNSCPRGDWMLWIASRLGVDKRLLVKTAGLCAATVKHLMKDQRSLNALKACEDYGNGNINDEELEVAAADAWDAAWDAADTAAAWAAAAYSAADTAAAWADAADAATDTDAAWAAWAAATADTDAVCADAAAADAKKQNQLLTANICHELLTKDVFKLIKKI